MSLSRSVSPSLSVSFPGRFAGAAVLVAHILPRKAEPRGKQVKINCTGYRPEWRRSTRLWLRLVGARRAKCASPRTREDVSIDFALPCTPLLSSPILSLSFLFHAFVLSPLRDSPFVNRLPYVQPRLSPSSPFPPRRSVSLPCSPAGSLSPERSLFGAPISRSIRCIR